MLDSDQWAEAEFSHAPLSNRLRSVRLIKRASLMVSVIGPSITANADYDWAAVKGHYRFLESNPSSAVTPTNIVGPHCSRTIERVWSQKMVLYIYAVCGIKRVRRA